MRTATGGMRYSIREEKVSDDSRLFTAAWKLVEAQRLLGYPRAIITVPRLQREAANFIWRRHSDGVESMQLNGTKEQGR